MVAYERHLRICLHQAHDLTLLWLAERGDRIAGFLFEPIQGEAGVCIFLELN